MKKIVFIAAMAAMLFSSCDRKEHQPINGTDEVRFAINGSVTRVTTTNNVTAFEVGDQIEITSSNLVTDLADAPYTVAATGLTGTGAAYYDGENSATFVAHYPAAAATDAQGAIAMTILSDQTSKEKFHNNMFMVAQAEGAAAVNAGLVSFTFEHQTAMLKVIVSGIDAAEAVTVNGVVPDVKWTKSGVEAGTAAPINVKAWKQGDTQEYWAVVPAQTFRSGEKFISITAGTKTYEYALTADLTVTAAKVKTVTLTVAESEKVEATFAIDEVDWTDDAAGLAGEVVEKVVPPVVVISAEDGNFANVAALTTGATGWAGVTTDGWNAVINGADSGTVTLNAENGCAEFKTNSDADWYKVAIAYKTSSKVTAGEYTLAVNAKSDVAGEFRYVVAKTDGTIINQNLYRATTTEYPESPYKNAVTLSEDYNGLIIAIAAKTPAGTTYSIKDVTFIEKK